VPTERLNAKSVTPQAGENAIPGASGCQAGFKAGFDGLAANAAVLPGITPPN
jgi:hypothetical protein